MLSKHILPDQEIDFITIDVEGFDLKVLKSIDLTIYKPKVILIEIINNKFDDFLTNEANEFLGANKYTLYARTVNTSIFIRNALFEKIKAGI